MNGQSHPTSSFRYAPLLSMQWLRYLGIVGLALAIYVVVFFYLHYGKDILSKSLTAGQFLQLSLYSVGAQISTILFPLLFFSGALRYHSLRKKGIHPVTAIKRDLLVILPLGIVIWVYGAFYESRVNTRFLAMVFEVQQLNPGEKWEQDPGTYELMQLPNMPDLQEKIDTLRFQIKNAEDQLAGQLAALIPPEQLDRIVKDIDFGSSDMDVTDIRYSGVTWDGINRDLSFLVNNPLPMVDYITELMWQQHRYEDEIRVIHFTPFYILLFLVFGMLLGYLIPFHKLLLTLILCAIGYAWYMGTSLFDAAHNADYLSESWVVLCKIGLLVAVNTSLLLLAIRVLKRGGVINPG